jgi:hypothetical protein
MGSRSDAHYTCDGRPVVSGAVSAAFHDQMDSNVRDLLLLKDRLRVRA